MANTMKALQSITVGAGGANNLTFTNIPQTYTDLIVKISGRTLAGGVADSLGMFINGVQTNRLRIALYGNGYNALSNSSTYRDVGASNGQGSTSNTFSNVEIYLPNYASNLFKSFTSNSAWGNNSQSADTGMVAGVWSSTAPITSLAFDSASAGVNFVQNSTFTLYGVFNQDVSSAPATPTIGTATAGDALVSITFTGVSGAASYTMTSSPGGFTATGTTSPITVTGLSNGTAYTFTVTANNPLGTSSSSAASNSVTPVAPAATPSIELIVVAGGGGATNAGAGAGGLCYQASRSVSAGTAYTVTIGSGGTSSPVNQAGSTNGGNSVFDTITALGGARSNTGSQNGSSGGSGSGSYGGYPGGTATQGNSGGATGYGNAGGASSGSFGSGGGGAGAAGGSENGGNGRQYWDESGTATYYAGGGGGHEYGSPNRNGTGGLGGGGTTTTTSGANDGGDPNTGGGASNNTTNPFGGGSGVVVLRYLKTYAVAASTTGSPTVGTDATYRYYKFTGSGSITF